jgi:hypothetical protein
MKRSLRVYVLFILSVLLPLSSILLSFRNISRVVPPPLRVYIPESHRSPKRPALREYTLIENHLNATELVSRSKRLDLVEDAIGTPPVPTNTDDVSFEQLENPPTGIHGDTIEPEKEEPLNSLFETDVLCPGCRYETAGSGRRVVCYNRIQKIMRKTNVSLAEAGAEVARTGVCLHCDPSSCSEEAKRYWRMDSIAPKILSATTHYLTSIKPEMRPPVDIDNLTSYFADPKNCWPKKYRDFFEFNPTIVRLPKHQIPKHLVTKDAVYLAGYRVSQAHKCDDGADTYSREPNAYCDKESKLKSYLGLAILSADLSILDHTVVEIWFKFEDPRLFILRNEIYFGSFSVLQKLWLVEPLRTDVPEGFYRAPTRSEPGQMEAWVGNKYWCPTDKATQLNGKNLVFFVDQVRGNIHCLLATQYFLVSLTSHCLI